MLHSAGTVNTTRSVGAFGEGGGAGDQQYGEHDTLSATLASPDEAFPGQHCYSLTVSIAYLDAPSLTGFAVLDARVAED